MKLMDLFEEPQEKFGNIPVVRNVKATSFDTFQRNANRNEFMGAGAFSAAYSKYNSNLVQKRTVLRPPFSESNTMIRFINLCIDHSDNPFFPRIYNAKIYFPVNDQPYMITVSEKLIHLDHIDDLGDIQHITDQLLIDLGIPDFVVDQPQKEEDDHSLLKHSLQAPSFREMLKRETTNPQFREALELLEPLICGNRQDMRKQNWMVRLTSVGPQLVINDPVMPGIN